MEKATMLQLRAILTDAKVKTEEGLSRSDLIELINKKGLTDKVLELVKKKGGKSIQPDVLESQSESEAEKPTRKVPKKGDKSEESESKSKGDISESKSEAEKPSRKASKSVDKSEGSESKSETKKAPGAKRAIKVTGKTNADSEADEEESEVKTPAKAKGKAPAKAPAKAKVPAKGKAPAKAPAKAKVPAKAKPKAETDSLSGSSEERVKPVRRAANVKPKATRAAAKTPKVVKSTKAVHVVIDDENKFIAAYAGLAKLKAALASHYPDSKYDDFLSEDGYEGVKVIDFIDWE